MKSRVNDDVVLFNEIRHSLNKEAKLLDMATRSKLTQIRFNVIDHALPQQRMINLNQDKFQWGMAAAVVAIICTVLVVVQLTPLKSNLLVALGGGGVSIEESIDEDTEEALEMYEWLYHHYG